MVAIKPRSSALMRLGPLSSALAVRPAAAPSAPAAPTTSPACIAAGRWEGTGLESVLPRAQMRAFTLAGGVRSDAHTLHLKQA